MRSEYIRVLSLSLSLLLAALSAYPYKEHKVKRGETVFGIAHMYQISADKILQLNPQANEGVKKDMILLIPDQDDDLDAKEDGKAKDLDNTPIVLPTLPKEVIGDSEPVIDNSQPVSQLISYLSKDGDTFESISKKTGVSVDKLIELNPFVDPIRIRRNTQIRLSDDAPLDIYADEYKKKHSTPSPITFDENIPPFVPNKDSDPEVIDDIAVDDDDIDIEIDSLMPQRNNMMILLPFLADKETQPKRSQQYADFYRGFLIAAQEIEGNGDQDVEVVVLDTGDDLTRIKHQLSNTADRQLAVIIAPEDDKQLQAVIDYATPQGVYVFNIFNFKDENYKINPYVIQGNITQQLMYEKAIEGIKINFPDFIPTILSPLNGREEKLPFVNALRESYANDGIQVLELPYDDALDEIELSKMLDGNEKYVLIPKSGSLNVFNSFAPAVINYRNKGNNTERIGVYGYPDWVMLRNEALDNLHRLNAIIYSRFDSDLEKEEIKNLQSDFLRWYSNPMLEAMPVQGALGYDVGKFLLSALQNGQFNGADLEEDVYSGIQSTFTFTHENDSEGLVNNALYLIMFHPDRRITAKVL